MHLTTQEVLALTENTLKQFIVLSIPEGLYLDYKERLSGMSEKESRREFLKDITAFANAAGGQLFIGVKEPREGISVEEQLVGCDDSAMLAQDLERLCSSSIDPRIPGLRIVPVPIGNGRSCLVIHVPLSLSRPHMVNYGGHRSFYVRHSESSFPMTTHEIREAVLASATAEARARILVYRRLQDARDSIKNRQAAFFIQAVPLIAPETSWDVLSLAFENVIRGESRINKYQHYADLVSHVAPRPTIDGLLGEDQRDESRWETEVHRTGYISLFYRHIRRHIVHNVDRFVLHSGTCDIFRAFCHMIQEFLEVSKTDLPYLLTCNYLNAEGTCIWTDSMDSRFSEPYRKNEIVWPEQLRATGTDPTAMAEILSRGLFNAFGYKQVVK